MKPRNWNELAGMDMDVEIRKARLMAGHMDAFLAALGALPTTEETLPKTELVPEYDCFCQDCGKRAGTMRLVTPPPDGFVRVRCNDCSAGDKPTEWPETGW